MQPDNHPRPPGDLTKKKSNDRPYLIGGLLLAVGVMVGLVVYTNFRGGSGGSGGDGAPIATFIPIWFAAMIPIIHKNKKDSSPETKTRRMVVALILGGLVAAGAVAFFVVNR